jgi:hypothetical protein
MSSEQSSLILMSMQADNDDGKTEVVKIQTPDASTSSNFPLAYNIIVSACAQAAWLLSWKKAKRPTSKRLGHDITVI